VVRFFLVEFRYPDPADLPHLVLGLLIDTHSQFLK